MHPLQVRGIQLQSADGLLVFNYPWNKQQWDQHKKAQVIVSFVNGRSLMLPLP